MPEKHWKIKRTKIERIEIVGPKGDSQAALDWLYDRGFRITRSGPYTDRKMHPKADMTRFLFYAERDA